MCILFTIAVHHTMGDVTFTDCTVGGFAGPGGSIGSTSVISQLQPSSGSESVLSNSIKNFNFQVHVGDRHRTVKIMKILTL